MALQDFGGLHASVGNETGSDSFRRTSAAAAGQNLRPRLGLATDFTLGIDRSRSVFKYPAHVYMSAVCKASNPNHLQRWRR